MKNALADGPFSEKNHGNTGLPVNFTIQRGTDSQRYSPGSDAVSTHEVEVLDRHVLAAATPAGVAVWMSENLRQHPRGIAAAAQQVPVAAMVAEYHVVGAEGHIDADRASFLADTQVGGAGDYALQEKFIEPQLESPDAAHGAVSGKQLVISHQANLEILKANDRRKKCSALFGIWHVGVDREGIALRIGKGVTAFAGNIE